MIVGEWEGFFEGVIFKLRCVSKSNLYIVEREGFSLEGLVSGEV